jgi:hypothetical protein
MVGLPVLPNVVLLLVGGIPTAVLVFLVVEALKFVGLVQDGLGARRANVIVALILGGLWATTQFYPTLAPIFEILFMALVGSLLSALGYVGVQGVLGRWRDGEISDEEHESWRS